MSKLVVLALFLIVSIAYAVASPLAACPSGLPFERIKCGDASNCVKRGCCIDWGDLFPMCRTLGLPAPPADQCKQDPHARKECGWGGISKEQCESKGCCFDNSVRNVKWCFHGKGAVCAAVEPNARIECGYGGIGRKRCLERGCCYDSSVRNVKWCFTQGLTAPPADHCKQDPQTRKECGWGGITRQQCESKGCCFNDSVPNVKWCFRGSDY